MISHIPLKRSVVAHEKTGGPEFQASLSLQSNFRTARATQRNSLKKETTKARITLKVNFQCGSLA